MTALRGDARAVLMALADPVLLVDRDGAVVDINAAAATLVTCDGPGGQLDTWCAAEHEAAGLFLSRCLGSSAPVLGALEVRTGTGPRRVQARGCRIGLADGVAVLLRLTVSDDERFRALRVKVEELATEVRQRARAEAILTETVAERELLLRELQHRVKNNMHMLSGMLLGSAREALSAEAGAALRDAAGRFAAVSAVQQLLYGSGALETVGIESLVTTLVRAFASLGAGQISTHLDVAAASVPIESAVPVALILNELLTNAVKHGRPHDRPHEIIVTLTGEPAALRLEVRDNGPGMDGDIALKRASGIGLVRGLLRQLGGRLDIACDGGTVCRATFSVIGRQRVGTAP